MPEQKMSAPEERGATQSRGFWGPGASQFTPPPVKIYGVSWKAAKVMSPSKDGPSWLNFEVQGEAKTTVPAGMALDLFVGLHLTIRQSCLTFQEINYFSYWKSIRQR